MFSAHLMNITHNKAWIWEPIHNSENLYLCQYRTRFQTKPRSISNPENGVGMGWSKSL